MTRDPLTAPRTAPRTSARRPWARASGAVVLAGVLGLTACGQQTSASVAASGAGGGGSTSSGTTDDDDKDTSSARVVRLDAGDAKPRMRCPTDERSVMVADFAVGAKGARTPQRAAGLSGLEDGERMVVSARGTRVWILRADGTARQTMHLTRMRGWLLHMRESCA